MWGGKGGNGYVFWWGAQWFYDDSTVEMLEVSHTNYKYGKFIIYIGENLVSRICRIQLH